MPCMDGANPPGTTLPEAPVQDVADAPRRSRRAYVAIAIFSVVVIVVGLALSSFGGDVVATTTATNSVSTVTRGSMTESVSADGTVEAAKTDDLSFPSAGTVTAVNVRAGDKVTAGQVLATIDPTELESAVATADANVADAAAQLANDKSSGTDEQIAADETNLTTAYDALASAKDDVAGASLVATFDGTVAVVNVTVGEELASGGTGSTSVTGTESGSGQSAPPLGGGSSTPNASASASTSDSTDPQIQVVSKGSYEVTLNVGSSDVDSVAVDQVATLTVSTAASTSSGGFPGFPGGGFPGGGGGATAPGGGSGPSADGSGDGASQTQSTGASATGKVTEVAQVADTSSGVAQYPVTIAFTASADDFYVGSNVSGSITTKTRTNVLQVPVRAVTTATDGTTTVKVAVDGTADGKSETRKVKTGLTSDGNIEITKGLEAGEKVIVAGIGGIPTGGAGGGSGAPTGGFPTGRPTGGNG
jgi:multidrug efflux pump subunit AcrA (membrane-fusion protein)